MNTPIGRMTGIFIPVEILEMEDLSLFETILLSWIDALYCPDHGGCFASNEYLGSKIRNAKENTVAKSLTKLRSMGLIEDVSFDGRQRVIRALINKHVDRVQSKAELDKNPTRVGQKSNSNLDKNPSYPITYSKDEIKDRKRSTAAPSVSFLSSEEINKERLIKSQNSHVNPRDKNGKMVHKVNYQTF